MILRPTADKPALLIRIGLAALVLANLAKWLLPRVVSISENLTDGATGFFFGLAIGTLLMGLYLRGRSAPGGDRCA